jgi:hypothetical protein
VEEQPLAGGNITAGVVRIGETVHRPTGYWSPAVHVLLRHLEEAGFGYSPRFLGTDDQDREILSYAPGVPIWPDAPGTLSEDANLARCGEILHLYLQAAGSFRPPPDARWWPGSADPAGGSVILHGDFAPWNIVVDGQDWTLIDWDSASPGRPAWELAYALHTLVPLWPDSGLSDARTTERIRILADACRLGDEALAEALGLAADRCRKVTRFLERQATAGEPAFVRMLQEGHGTSWHAAADHIDQRLPTWTGLLGFQ